MKKILALLALVSLTAFAADPAAKKAEDIAKADAAKAKAEKVCIKTTDAKTGKEVEKCKVMKKHEKHEGTAVPDGKKK